MVAVDDEVDDGVGGGGNGSSGITRISIILFHLKQGPTNCLKHHGTITNSIPSKYSDICFITNTINGVYSGTTRY